MSSPDPRHVVLPLTLLGVAAALRFVPHPAPDPAPQARTADRERGTLRPPPTEHRVDPDAERRNKAGRKAWFRELQQAPPDVDVRAVQRAVGLAQTAKRNALSAAPPPPDGATWTERGSVNQAGRMHSAAHSADHRTLYAGSALGGVWRAALDGSGWTPIGDNLYGGAHWLAVNATQDGDVVLAATDWGAIHTTDDDGATWTAPGGLGSPDEVRRVLTLTDGSETVFLVLREGERSWVARSTDGLGSFEEVADLGGFRGDLWAPRDGGSRLHLLGADGVRTSDDEGETWSSPAPLPHGAWIRGELAGSEAGAPTLYAVLSDDTGPALVRSDDAGASWARLPGEVPDYWGTLNASIEDAARFAYGGVEVHRSRDGGESFDVVNAWHAYYDAVETTLHADIMGIEVFTGGDGEELWYIATDGGLYRSVDRLETVENLSLDGLRVSQYYDTHTSAADPRHVAAGAQDQGYQLTQGMDQGGPVLAFDQVISGDYGHLTSGDGTHDTVFSVYPGFMLVQLDEDDPWLAYVDFPTGEQQAWLPPIVADPAAPDHVFFCATRLWYYTASQDGWTPELWSEHDFSRDDGEYLSAFALSPFGSGAAFAATNYGRLFTSADRGRTWAESDDTGPYGHYFYGTALLPSRTDPDVIWAGGSGYGGPAVYRSTDRGQTWEPWSDGLPSTTVYSLAEAPDGSGRLVAGTQHAAYRRDPGDTAWRDITGAEAPVTTYWSAEPLTDENTVRFGTYGRGIWDYGFEPAGDCTFGEDADGDGVPCQEDCDDADPEVHPGATEGCDGVDQNCDPTDLDERDGDGDGYLACEDCNDTRATTNPGAQEICGNGIDEDCDGEDAPASDCARDDDDDDDGARGCGCSGAPGPASLGLALIGGLVLRRRRRSAAT